MTEQSTDALKTRTDVIKVYGEPISETANEKGFFANSYEEDCFLARGGRKHFDKRLVFPKSVNKVVYLDSDNNIMGIF
jgi:hypothetical protein